MSKKWEETPKPCENCGGMMTRKKYRGRLEDRAVFERRRFCSLSCANTRTDISKSGWLWRVKKYRKKNCEACGIAERLQVHHVDGNHKNTNQKNQKNLQTLCIWCHRFIHHTADRRGWKEPGRLPSLAWQRAFPTGWPG